MTFYLGLLHGRQIVVRKRHARKKIAATPVIKRIASVGAEVRSINLYG